MTARTGGLARPLALALAALAPVAASAAGFDVPENGALMLARGGTAVSGFGNAYALQFNPAGMSTIEGLDVRIDARLVNHAVSFQRDAADMSYAAVANSGGVFVGPAVEVAYRLKNVLDGRLSIGLGVWGPPGVGKYAYPDPEAMTRAGKQSADVKDATPQRYGLIESNILILYPSLGASWKFSDLVSVGVTLQDAIATVSFSQSIAAQSLNGTEDTTFDAIVKLHVSDSFAPTGVLGVALTPSEHLRIGASFRPQVAIKGTGTMDVALPEIAKALGYKVVGAGTATLALNLQPVAHLGAAWVDDRFSVSGELTYEGWHTNQKMVLTPDVEIQQGTNEPVKLAAIDIDKKWKDSMGARLGGSFTVLEYEPKKPMLELHAGALFESNAIPAAYQAIDFVTGDRVAGSLGASFHWNGFAFTAAGMLYKPVSLTVTDSKVARAAAEVESPPVIVGNGTYTSKVWVAAFGLAYSGLGGK